jgi:chitin deacetylase
MHKFIKFIVFLLVTSLFLMINAWLLLQISKSRSFQFFGGITNRVKTGQRVVALTFDDAPSPYVDEVLKILAAKKVKATFYTVGAGIKDYPEETKKIVQAGHELGNHSYSHQRILAKSSSFIDSEIQQTNTLIRESGYQGEITFRPPYCKKLLSLPWYLKQHDIKTITCDVEAETYAGNLTGEEKAKFLIDYTVKKTKPGSIILLHPLCQSCSPTRQAIGEIIDQLKEQGYSFVTVNELLELKED